MTRPSRWLITGGCGFIGSSLIRRLLLDESGGHRIRVLDDLSRGSLDALPQGTWREGIANSDEWADEIEVIVGPVEEPSSVGRVMQGVDVVVHFAANAGVVQSIEDPLRDLEVNVQGTACVLQVAQEHGARRIVLASSAAAVGTASPPISESTLPRPSTPYGAGKLAAEAYAGAFAQTFGLETVCLRFGNVYGPLSSAKDSVVARFIKQWLRGETLEVYGDGGQTRDFIYLHDLLAAVELAALKPSLCGEVFQIATGAETSINELVEVLSEVIRKSGGKPPTVVYGAARSGDVRRNYSDTSHAESLLGWQADVDLESGLTETVRWFLENEV